MIFGTTMQCDSIYIVYYTRTYKAVAGISVRRNQNIIYLNVAVPFMSFLGSNQTDETRSYYMRDETVIHE